MFFLSNIVKLSIRGFSAIAYNVLRIYEVLWSDPRRGRGIKFRISLGLSEVFWSVAEENLEKWRAEPFL